MTVTPLSAQDLTSLEPQPELGTPPEIADLPVSALFRATDVAHLPDSTRKVEPLNDFLGQTRARQAVETALALPFGGYNIFAAGTNGLGKRTMLTRLLRQHAANMPTPSDWVYLNHFADPRQPIALELPPSEGPKLKKALHQLWHTLLRQLERAFSSEPYLQRIESIRQAAGSMQQQALQELTKEGEALNLVLVSQDERHRFVPAPSIDATPLTAQPPTPEALPTASLHSAQIQQPTKGSAKSQSPQSDNLLNLTADAVQVRQQMRQMDKKLERLGARLGRLEDQSRDQIMQLNAELAAEVVLPRVQMLEQRFEHVDGLARYLKAYANDIIEHVNDILSGEDEDFLPAMFDRVPTRYQVNVMVTHKVSQGAPVVFEDLPTHYNLLGHVEQLTQMGTISTDFTLIRAGALHRANGGFLMLEAEQILEQPYAWQGLKRVLKSGQLRLSSLEQMLTLTGSISLEPQSIPLQLKIIMLGEPQIYYELLEFEPELNSLFKIRADFSDTLPRTLQNEQAYIQLIADYVHKEKLLHLNQAALAELLADSSRHAEDQQALSLHAASLGDLLCESSALARQMGAKIQTAEHIQQALEARRYRSGYLRELYWHDLKRGTQLIETQGLRIGQINALTVVHYADSEFGLPARLTASVYQGGGDILDIERSVELGGALHAKGVLIMSSFLRAHFGRQQPLHFSAALAFEQNYGDIDGDSATMAELCALISAISQLPLDQSWAITGSMNQLGVTQPIGGVNAKIEGFFDACALFPLTGQQGVIIPAQNVQHLMLRADVRHAVEQGFFHVRAVQTIGEALSILMHKPVGNMDSKGRYPKGSIYATVMKQLKLWQRLESGDIDTKKGKSKKHKVKSKKDKNAKLKSDKS